MGATGWAEPWLLVLGQAAVRVTLWLTITVAAAWALRRAAATARRWIWVAAIVGALLLPLAGLLRPIELKVLPANRFTRLTSPWLHYQERLAPSPREEHLSMVDEGGRPPSPRDEGRLTKVPLLLPPAHPVVAGRAVTPPTAAQARPANRLSQSLLGIYAVGLLVALIRLGRARGRAADLLRGARPAPELWLAPAGVDVRESDRTGLPITIGSVSPVVLVPSAGREWEPAWRTAILAHEAAHVRSRDPLWQLLAELACALYWFHPLIYLAAHQLRVEREMAADDAALAAGMRASEYARLLYELASAPAKTASTAGAVVPLLTPAGLKTRVFGLLDAARARRTRPLAVASGFAMATLALVPLALALPVPRGPLSPILVRKGEIMGRVIDQRDGQPAADAEVVFRFRREVTVRTSVVTTDQQGWFRYPDDEEPQADFGVYARKNGRAARKNILPIRYGTQLPVTLELGRAHVMAGTVRGQDGSVIADATVRVVDGWGMEAPPPGRQVLARTDAQGRWRIDGVMYGAFRLLVEAPWGVATTVYAHVEDQDVAGLDVALAREWAVTGWLRDEVGQPMPGVRLEHETMRFFSGGPHGWRMRMRPGQRYLDWDESAADGSFRLLQRGMTVTVLAAGRDGRRRFAQFEHGAERRVLHGKPGQPARATVQPGRLPVVVVMKPTARISGVVVDQHGTPVVGTTVHAQPLRMGPPDSPPVTTDERGRFTLTDVPPMDVFLAAPHDPSAHPDVKQATHVRPEPGEHLKNIQVKLMVPPAHR